MDSAGVFVQVWPDWSPSRVADMARFPALVKVAAGASVPVDVPLELRVLDAAGNVLDAQPAAAGAIVGPAWQVVPGKLVQLPEAAEHVEVALGGAVSDRVDRADARRPLLVRRADVSVGVSGEPALWWCYRNTGKDPIDAERVVRTMRLWIDGTEQPLPPAPYNGPAELPPGRAMSGWWPRELVGDAAERTAVEVLGERAEA